MSDTPKKVRVIIGDDYAYRMMLRKMYSQTMDGLLTTCAECGDVITCRVHDGKNVWEGRAVCPKTNDGVHTPRN